MYQISYYFTTVLFPRIINMTVNDMDQSLMLSVIEVCVYSRLAI